MGCVACSCVSHAHSFLIASINYTAPQILNFSIAYGKTAHGLAADWNVTVEEAKDTLEKWYRDRPEVRRVHVVSVLHALSGLVVWSLR